ncbi:PDZ domain-containing protein [Paraflavitalea sp. CAU 1676]|uniref:PDZ domain-containing protein n=1 Tax=Paraflavitalea sp. CAU 1676 TaxID=3032598 RepID=UPI0023D9DEE5|nr:PDZ domain-containing protein [Paraflavitalea sp. CAU 1676]MDF2187144.1 PDZ domain-containing protein [Paraflavitalea sp. CAU 1676]
MRRYFLPLTGMAALLLVLLQPVKAQDEKNSDKDKDKVKQYDEIIIRKKTDKDGKVVVEIKDGNVIVNGKPLADYEDENISVRKRKSMTFSTSPSPFRGNGGSWNFSGDGFNADAFSGSGNTPFLGVSTDDGKEGAKIEEVTKGSAAEKAGLKKGDILIKIDEDKVFTPDDVVKAVKKHKPEDKVAITYKRDGKELKTTATLGKRGNAMAFSSPDVFVAPQLEGLEGLKSFDFNWDNDDHGPRVYTVRGPRLGIKAQDTEDGKGVKVLDVDDESIAEKAGVKENDIITEFNGKTVNSADELAEAARAAKEKPSVTVKLLRDGKAQTLELKTPKKLKTANL